MKVLLCWNLDIRHAIAIKPAATVNGTGKAEAAVKELVSVVLALLPLPGE
jgi:hypothetical protein